MKNKYASIEIEEWSEGYVVTLKDRDGEIIKESALLTIDEANRLYVAWK